MLHLLIGREECFDLILKKQGLDIFLDIDISQDCCVSKLMKHPVSQNQLVAGMSHEMKRIFFARSFLQRSFVETNSVFVFYAV